VKIYTRTGDEGDTALFDGTRVSKADARVDAYGEVDELASWLGVVRARTIAPDFVEMLERIQRDLFALGAQLADPRHRIAARVEKAIVGGHDVTRLEGWIDALESELPPLRRFILPGGGRLGSIFHYARTVCRRAERRVVALGAGQVDGVIVTYLNRLSDLLFTMGRAANARDGAAEIEW
jgi:cob(I)alamin adenosyltransferase